MRRFFIADIDCSQKSLVVEGSEARHMIKVLRMSLGDRCIVTDKEGNSFKTIIKKINSGKVSLDIEEQCGMSPNSPVKIFLCQSLLKGKLMDLVIEKASELGAYCVIPVISSRSVAVPADNVRKITRWNSIAISSVKQSSRAIAIKISDFISFKEMLYGLEKNEKTLFIIAWEEEKDTYIKNVLRKSSLIESIYIMIGPEGGFSEEEVLLAKEFGFTSVSLGRRILKAETAAITMVGLLQYELGDFGNMQ